MNFFHAEGLQWADVSFLGLAALRTIMVSLVAGLLASAISLLVGWLRFQFHLFKLASDPVIDVFRSIPLLIIFIIVNTVQLLLGWALDPLVIGIGVLAIYGGSFGAEFARAGFAAVDPRLRRAARSLGMGAWSEARLVLFPLAIRTIQPAWVGLMLSLVKDSALISIIGYIELLRAAQIVVNRTNEPFIVFAVAGLFYFAISYPVSLYGRRLEARMKHDLD